MCFSGVLDNFGDIFWHYNKWHKLWFDIVAVFPFEIFSFAVGCTRLSHYHAITFLRLNRALYFFRYVPSSFVRWENMLDVKIVRVRTVKFIMYVYTITHLSACVFYWTACGYFMQR